jgi:hypothetical protein
MKKSTFSIPILVCILLFVGLGSAVAQTYDISSGGAPTITGGLSASVTGSSSVLNNLSVTINFGEVSPANTHNIVKVVVPIAVRSNQRYQVAVTVNSFTTGTSAMAVKKTDIGFGARNLRSMGSNAQVCTGSSHIFPTPFNNDPATGVTIDAAGRATYTSTLNNVSGATVILRGPRLTNDISPVRQTNNGYIFDAIFVITPQFYAQGATSAVLTFTISQGPASPC